MSAPPAVTVRRILYGILPEALLLNPRFVPNHPLLLATLEIRWKPLRPRHAIAALERELLAFSPSFARHECRGDGAYHLLAAGEKGETPAEEEAWSAIRSFEAPLALAHLIEHAVIDFQTGVTAARRCSGVTAAYLRDSTRFDLLVECREPEVGSCCLLLAVSWITRALAGKAPAAPEREVLEVLRLIVASGRGSWVAPSVARSLGWSEARGERALAALRKSEFLEDCPGTMNFSGCREYRVRRGFHSPAAAVPGV
jgi:hypothetical protein